MASIRDFRIAQLADIYGELLPARQLEALDYSYNYDLSLSEVANMMGITRQGVLSLLKKAQESLKEYEQKLGLLQLTERLKSLCGSMCEQDAHLLAQILKGD